MPVRHIAMHCWHRSGFDIRSLVPLVILFSSLEMTVRAAQEALADQPEL